MLPERGRKHTKVTLKRVAELFRIDAPREGTETVNKIVSRFGDII